MTLAAGIAPILTRVSNPANEGINFSAPGTQRQALRHAAATIAATACSNVLKLRTRGWC